MKIIINREVLLESLQKIIGVVERRQTMPILGHILVTGNSGEITVTATDLEVQISSVFKANISDDFSITLPGRKLFDILRSLGNTEVELSASNETVVLKTDKSKFSLQQLPANEFPLFDNNESDQSFTMAQTDLSSVFNKTQFAMAQQDVRFYLNGLLLEIKPESINVVGTDSLICEVEFIQVFYEVLTALKIPDFNIKINNRKVLAGIAEVIGEVDKIIDITVAIDKLDKIGIEKVNEELASRGLSQKAIDQLQPLISFEGSKQEAFSFLRTFLKSSETGMKGVEELAYIVDYCSELNIDKCLTLDLTLARGLNYYTGAIFEVSCKNFKGSICGGGRYDGLTDQFGLKGIGCAGISFGADRIYDVLEENNLFPQDDMDGLDVLFANFGLKEEHYVMTFVQQLRSKGLSVEVFPTAAKMKKQLSYADYRNAKHVVMIGENEMNSGTIRVKNMLSGHQEDCSFDDFIQKL